MTVDSKHNEYFRKKKSNKTGLFIHKKKCIKITLKLWYEIKDVK